MFASNSGTLDARKPLKRTGGLPFCTLDTTQEIDLAVESNWFHSKKTTNTKEQVPKSRAKSKFSYRSFIHQ
jgi:hypothetical protein